jgi:hypothetical protein
VPWQLASSAGLAEREEGIAPGASRRGEPPRGGGLS